VLRVLARPAHAARRRKWLHRRAARAGSCVGRACSHGGGGGRRSRDGRAALAGLRCAPAGPCRAAALRPGLTRLLGPSLTAAPQPGRAGLRMHRPPCPPLQQCPGPQAPRPSRPSSPRRPRCPRPRPPRRRARGMKAAPCPRAGRRCGTRAAAGGSTSAPRPARRARPTPCCAGGWPSPRPLTLLGGACTLLIGIGVSNRAAARVQVCHIDQTTHWTRPAAAHGSNGSAGGPSGAQV